MTSVWIVLVLFCLFHFSSRRYTSYPTAKVHWLPKCQSPPRHQPQSPVPFLHPFRSQLWEASWRKQRPPKLWVQCHSGNQTTYPWIQVGANQSTSTSCLCWEVESDLRKLVGSKRRSKLIGSLMTIPPLLLSIRVSLIDTNTHYVVHSHWSYMLLLPSILVYIMLNNKYVWSWTNHSRTCSLVSIWNKRKAIEMATGILSSLRHFCDSSHPVKSWALHNHSGVTAWVFVFVFFYPELFLLSHFSPGFMT